MAVQFNRFHPDVQRPAAFQHTKGKQWKVKYPLFTEVFEVRPQNRLCASPFPIRLRYKFPAQQNIPHRILTATVYHRILQNAAVTSPLDTVCKLWTRLGGKNEITVRNKLRK